MSGYYVEPPSDYLWIDKTRHLILREIRQHRVSTMHDSISTSKVTYTYNVVKANEPLPESLFVFSPPTGSREVAELSIPGASRAEVGGGAMVGREAFDFALKDLSGREVSLKTLRGKVILINFWASWCGPCRVEMPYLEKLHREFKGKDVVILGINDERPEVARGFLEKNGYTFSTLVDERREVARNYQVSGIPQVFVIGRDGRVVTHYVGAHSEGDFRAALTKAGVGAQKAAAMQITDSSSPGYRTAAQPPCVPILLSPRSGDALDNGLIGKSKQHIWEFAWTECPNAAEYHLYVIGPRAIYPVIDDDNIRMNSYRRTSDNGYVADPNLRGWTWKVRARINGEWGEWSKTGTFNVKPVASDSGSAYGREGPKASGGRSTE
jgi:peroxiredoxin